MQELLGRKVPEGKVHDSVMVSERIVGPRVQSPLTLSPSLWLALLSQVAPRASTGTGEGSTALKQGHRKLLRRAGAGEIASEGVGIGRSETKQIGIASDGVSVWGDGTDSS